MVHSVVYREPGTAAAKRSSPVNMSMIRSCRSANLWKGRARLRLSVHSCRSEGEGEAEGGGAGMVRGGLLDGASDGCEPSGARVKVESLVLLLLLLLLLAVLLAEINIGELNLLGQHGLGQRDRLLLGRLLRRRLRGLVDVGRTKQTQGADRDAIDSPDRKRLERGVARRVAVVGGRAEEGDLHNERDPLLRHEALDVSVPAPHTRTYDPGTTSEAHRRPRILGR
eukprot:879239-Prymnesium_polylepis.1